MSSRAPHILIAAVCWLFLGAAAAAAPRSADQFYHTQWTTQDGAPPGIQTLVQTADGYLWMSNGAGLFRFDGVHFERISRVGGQELLSANISTLWAAERGMWIGYRFGGATYMEGDRLTHYPAGEGLPVGTTLRFAPDGSGSLLAATTTGLFRLVDGKWSPLGNEWNIPASRFYEIASDKAGTIWASSIENVCRFLRRGAQRFEDCTVPDKQALSFLLPRDGAVWMISRTQRDALILQATTDGARLVIEGIGNEDHTYSFAQARFDRQGQLWLAGEQGARRLDVSVAAATAPGQSGKAARELHARELNGDRIVPLTGRYVSAILEDREGSIWFATSGGLDQLRAPALSRADLPSGSMTYAIAPSHDGAVWIGTSSEQLFRISSDLRQTPVPAPAGEYGCFYLDPKGDLWIGLRNEIWQLHAGRWQASRLPIAQRSRTAPGEIQSMAMDTTGAMWVSVVRVGVFKVVGDEWTLWGGRTDLPPEAATIVAADERGRVWFGYVDGKVAVLDGDRVTTFTSKDGLAAGTVFAIVPRGANVWIGGERGMFHFDGQTFRPIRRAEGAFAAISGIVELDTGDLWLNTGDGAVRIEASEARNALSDPSHVVSYKLLNYLDGMPGVPFVIRPLPTVVVDKQQRVWFATSDGVAWTDAQPRVRNEVIPTVLVKSVRADGGTYQWTASQPLQLPVRTRNLEIAYTALSLAIPERVRFKYRLEGNDSGWQDVGTRREAFFNDLPPGKYRFQVIASNNDGLWNETGAALEFVIPPTFVQTPWFTALLVGSVLGIVWLAFAIRFRHAKAQLRWRLEERLVERERIARELHDTFLQGVQGLMLRFQSATERIPKHEPARALMEEALDRADLVLADGRDKVTSLRSSSQTSTSLPQALSVLGSELAQDYTATFELSVEGEECDLHPVIREEAFRIGAEALANAFRHAQATRIQVRISYTRRALVLLVRDDGRGFNTDRSQIPAGHWGLKGMEERAARIRAQLTLSSSASQGTSVELKVPARMAFKSGRSVRRISET
ncbi:sensor histidine kinase [Steroidobacter agaridevorans]|uniref:sensor histidine kinase n=1 Tax=Steroidobacter agaridevorans TaxID=2695856 RepID=UPI00132A21DC|nr:sensor histidine kinase [Steroidobacter agaridevorans]GFE88523.1 histidine kinase [Steroidobacter agaridevorans]